MTQVSEKNEVLEVLMRRDGMTRPEAVEMILQGREDVLRGGDYEDILQYDFGLEPDYIFDLIWGKL